MASWDHEFAVDFVNEGHFYFVDPGPLHAPIQGFSLRRDQALNLILETKAVKNATSTAAKHPSGTVRQATETASLENVAKMKVMFSGVMPYQTRSTNDYKTGESEVVEEAKINAVEAVVRSELEPANTIDWLENFPEKFFFWPDSIENESVTSITQKIGSDEDGITLFDEDGSRSTSYAALKCIVYGVEIYVCSLKKQPKSEIAKPGCIIYVGNSSKEFRKKVRTSISFIVSSYLIELGHAVYGKKWEIVSFESRSSYSIGRRVLDLPILPPAPTGVRFLHEIDRTNFTRLVTSIVQNYEALDFGNMSWAYWHALCAAPHIASVHFGAVIEMLLRKYKDMKPDTFPGSIIGDKSIWKSVMRQVENVVKELKIPEINKEALIKNIGALNRVHHRDTMSAILKNIGIELGDDEMRAWKRRNDAAHGIAIEVGEEFQVIRDVKLLKIVFHRILLRIIDGADAYYDYATPDFPVRKLAEPVPSASEP